MAARAGKGARVPARAPSATDASKESLLAAAHLIEMAAFNLSMEPSGDAAIRLMRHARQIQAIAKGL